MPFMLLLGSEISLNCTTEIMQIKARLSEKVASFCAAQNQKDQKYISGNFYCLAEALEM